MKIALLFAFILLYVSSFSQSLSGEWSLVLGKKYVFLGEPTHGDGAVFDEKLKIIKQLHEQSGFNVIAFESSLYDNYKAWQLYISGKDSLTSFNKSVFDIWSGRQFFQQLLSYVAERAAIKDTLRIAGFDSQHGDLFEDYFFEDLKESFAREGISYPDDLYEELQLTFDMDEDLTDYAVSQKKTKQLFKSYQDVLQALEGYKQPIEMDKVLLQTLRCNISAVQLRISKLKGAREWVQNTRDSLMADNFVFLGDLYPKEKIIAWGANYHFANNLQGIKTNEVTKRYADEMLAQQKLYYKDTTNTSDSTVEDIDDLQHARSMGRILKQRLGDAMYAIGFTCRTGTFSGFSDDIYNICLPPENSIEAVAFKNGKDKVLIDKKDLQQETFCAALGYIPMLAKWNEVFDGIYFINVSYPPLDVAYKKASAVNDTGIGEGIRWSATVVNAADRQPIPFADVFARSGNRSVVTNQSGQFTIVLPVSSAGSYITVAAFGYISDSFKIAGPMPAGQIILLKAEKKNMLLEEVQITSKRVRKKMSAKDIIKKARSQVDENYHAQAYNQQFFFRVKNVDSKDSLTFKEEAMINTYNRRGMAHTSNITTSLSAEIAQFRSTTKKIERDKWAGVGIFGFTLNRDLVMNKRNVLYRSFFYRAQVDTILDYDGRNVYKISFYNKRPGPYTTGIGYPSPESSYGTLYIDASNYAILRYEHIIVRKPTTYKYVPGYTFYATLKITETYKQTTDGFFLNYFNFAVKSKKVNNSDTNVVVTSYNVQDIMSANINLKDPAAITQPVLQLKAHALPKEDPVFWQQHSVFVEEMDYHF